jgi:hypothetical protein
MPAMDRAEREYEEQMAQLDPELRARLEEWRTAQTLAGGEPLTDEEVAEARFDRPGTWNARLAGSVVRDFLRAGGWSAVPTHGRTGQPVGRPTTYPDGMPPEELERLRQRVGFTHRKFRRLVPGTRRRRSMREAQQRAVLARSLSIVIDHDHGTGIVRHLADAYGTTKGTISKLGAQGRALARLAGERADSETKSPKCASPALTRVGATGDLSHPSEPSGPPGPRGEEASHPLDGEMECSVCRKRARLTDGLCAKCLAAWQSGNADAIERLTR